MVDSTRSIPLPILVRCYAGPLTFIATIAMLRFVLPDDVTASVIRGIGSLIAVSAAVGVAASARNLRSMRRVVALLVNSVLLWYGAFTFLLADLAAF